ncbi:SEL1-like repeat protein [Candidatus Paracaedibacter symbiosus]|uniref:SEL1-like repeat protein n=1 Tax=Candidatus Paracaedibacter symbiosus TaxID=244582 RepID=UPI00068D9288|nr:SEL1-like repeat protein [Candidatus Paracaedibacter symbiosus]
MTYLHTTLAVLLFFSGLPGWASDTEESNQTQYIALYRGIHFFKGIFEPTDITRAIESSKDEQNSHSLFSSTAGALIGANYLTSLEEQGPLLRSGQLVHTTLKKFKEQHPDHYYTFHERYTNNHFRFHTLLGDDKYRYEKGASNNITQREIEAFEAYKEIFFKEAEDPEYKLGSLNKEGILRNCFVSFSQGPQHALRYAVGLKYMVGGEYLRPDYDDEGIPQNKCLGKVYIALLKKQDFYALNPTSVLDLHAQGKVKIETNQKDILAEEEVSFLGYLDQAYVSYALAVKVPSFNKGYKAKYKSKYGLSKDKFGHFKTLKKGINLQSHREELLENHIIPAYSNRLNCELAQILKRKGESSVLTFVGYGKQLGEVLPSAVSHILHQLHTFKAADICPGKGMCIGNQKKMRDDSMIRRFSLIIEHVSQAQAIMFSIRNYNLNGLGDILKPLLTSNTLEVLSLKKLGLGPQDAAQIAEGLKSNTSLAELTLNSNPIKDEGSKAIAKALEDNKSLKKLQILGTQTTAEGLNSFGALLKYDKGKQKNTSLTELLFTRVKTIPTKTVEKIENGLRRNRLKNYSTAAARNGAAKGKNTEAQHNLIMRYLKDNGITLDDIQTAYDSHHAPEVEDATEQFYLGVKYFMGINAPENYIQAAHWFKKAAKQGVANAQYCLAMMYVEAKGVPKNDTLAVRWLEKAAKQKVAEAQYNLGLRYVEGKGVAKDERQAVFWYEEAAKQGHKVAQCNLGYMYQKGCGIEKDVNRAMYWYIEAARRDQGFVGAQYNLGVMYEKGCDGIEKNGTLAKLWYEKAAEQGHKVAQYNLGVMYTSGRGVPKDDTLAAFWYKKAAGKGHKVAQYNLGVMYKNGCGVEKDDTLAVNWFKKAAEQGHADAQFYLGMIYENGCDGIAKDDVLAALWYERAAKQGHADAQCKLGYMYVEGLNFSKAIYWLREAAEQGVEEAACILPALDYLTTGC